MIILKPFPENILQKKVIGQDMAIGAVANAVRRARAGLQDPDRPLGSFIFLGPTGVGKTELARTLADFLFDSEQAMIRIAYPGASALEVEEELTLPVENTLQQLAALDNVTSTSSARLSQIMVEMKSTYRKAELEQIWDEMRRKVNDRQGSLPPGAGPSLVNDDFGDVYGVMLFTHPDPNFFSVATRELLDIVGNQAMIAVVLEAQARRRAAARVLTTLPSGWRNSNMPPQSVSFAGPDEPNSLTRPVDSLALLQATMGLWAFAAARPGEGPAGASQRDQA